MAVEIPLPLPLALAATEFSFDVSACPTPYITAPPSPKRVEELFYSATTSPTRVVVVDDSAATNRDSLIINSSSNKFSESSSAIPFDWEEKPGKPKSTFFEVVDDDDDFAFDFGSRSERYSHTLSASDLFDGAGKIRPLKPPPGSQLLGTTQLNESSSASGTLILKNLIASSSSRLPKSSQRTKKMFRNAFSTTRPTTKDIDPFMTAIEKTRNDSSLVLDESSSSSLSCSHRRSFSSFRVCESSSTSSTTSSSSASSYSSKGYRKRRLMKDLLLFRSSADEEEVPGSGQERNWNRVNRVGGGTGEDELFKRKSSSSIVPYKQGLLGCLGFNRSVHGLVGKGLESLSRG